jgi:PAS domain-containing protein
MALDFPSVIMVFVTIIAFVIAWALNRITLLRIRKGADKIKQTAAIMQHTLDMGRNYVLMLDIRQRHAVNIHGDLLPEEGMSYEESFELIHPDDHHIYQTFIKRLLSGEAETDECIFRWDISGSKHLGQWCFMEDKGIAEYTKTSLHPVHIFCTLTDRTEQILLEREAQEMTNKYRRIFEQSLTGLAFYDENGRLLTTNKKMREILKFQSEKDPFYYDNTLFDMPTFRELLNNRRVENLYFCTKSIIIERGVNCYTEMRVHPIYKNDGQLYCITFSIRDVSQERELYLQNKKNSLDIRLANEAIMQYENDIQYLMDTCNMRFFRTSFAKRQCYFYKTLGTPESQMDFDTLIAHFVDSPFRQGLMEPEKFFNVPQTTVTHMHPFFHEGEELQWNIIDSAPYFD